MDKTETLRLRLSELVSDTMGKDCGELYYKFYQDDKDDSVIDGAKALLQVMLGPEMTDKKIAEARKKL